MKSRLATLLGLMTMLAAAGCNSGGGEAASNGTAGSAPKAAPTAKKSSAPTDTTSAGDLGQSSKTAGSSGSKKPDNTASAPAFNLAGTWTNDNKDIVNSMVEFTKDGSVHVKGDIPGAKGVSIEATGSYTIDNGKLTIKTTAAKMIAADDAPSDVKKLVDQRNKEANEPGYFDKQPPNVTSIEWKDKDHFTTTNSKEKKVVHFSRAASHT